MAEDSFPWNGTTIGDAASTTLWSAPYSSAEWADVHGKILHSNSSVGYVVPDYGSSLSVAANSPAAMNVLVGTGALVVRGRLYENTAQMTVSVATADATNPRLDRIIARITFSSTVQTIRIAVLTGTPAATPTLPTLTQTALIYEVPLANIWVAAATATIAATEVHDERSFAPNFDHLLSILAKPNYLTNSEFMAFSRLDANGTTNPGPPDGGWTLIGTVTTWASGTRPTQMSRGRAVTITAGAATSGMQQTIQVRASTVYVIKGLINVTAGDVGRIVVTTNSASPGTVTKNIRRTGTWIEYQIVYATEADASTLTVQLLCVNNTDVVSFGQFLINEGRIAGPFRQIHETIYFDWLLSDPDFDSDAFAADVDTTIDLDSDYQAMVLSGTRAVGIVAYLQSTAAATTTSLVGLQVVGGGSVNLAEFNIQNGTNNINYTSQDMWIPVDANNQFIISVRRGAGTLTVGMYIKAILI